MASAFTFRCPKCRKLLGASRSRIGTVLECPKCRVEITVPSPEEPAPAAPRAGAAPAPPPPAFEPFLPSLELGDDPFSLRGAPADRALRVPGRTTSSSGETPALLGSSSGNGVAAVAVDEPGADGVSLPRSAVAAWGLAAVLGMAFAFVAGLLVGHFAW